jgi:hypothetical protein
LHLLRLLTMRGRLCSTLNILAEKAGFMIGIAVFEKEFILFTLKIIYGQHETKNHVRALKHFCGICDRWTFFRPEVLKIKLKD